MNKKVDRAILHAARAATTAIVNDSDKVETGPTLEEVMQTKGGKLKAAFIIAVPLILIVGGIILYIILG